VKGERNENEQDGSGVYAAEVVPVTHPEGAFHAEG
jgi:hypothetical protein